MATLIKCCGMFRPEDIAAVNAARPDMCGFVIDFPKSHRNITPEQAAQLRQGLRTDIEAVGVFVDEDPEVIAQLVDDCVVDLVQLHGSEDEAYIANLRSLCDTPIIQAFKVETPTDVERACASSAEIILLDAGQGCGQTFDWSLVKGIDRPFILAGGLTPETLGAAIAQVHPWAVDLSSALETDKLKDGEKIATAVATVRALNSESCGNEPATL